MDSVPDIYRNMNVLTVDDDETVLKLYAKLLKDMGLNVVPARSAQETFEKTDQQRVDMAILDLKLPDADGIDILYRLKDLAGNIPIIIVTGNPSLESSIEAIKSGVVYDYVVKPFSGTLLEMVIRRAIEKAALTYENKRLFKKVEKTNQALAERVDELERFARLAVDYEEKMAGLTEKIKELEDRMGT